MKENKFAPVIELVSVQKAYQIGGSPLVVLKPTTLTIRAKEYVSIKGPSGSGKSTLMHVMSLLDLPTSGVVRFLGQDVSLFSESKLAKLRNSYIGFVFQQFNLLPKTSAWENVSLPLVYSGISLPERHRRAAGILRQMGLGDRLENRPNQLSGGQQQRVAIARSLINEPDIIFADEPTGNLDSASGNMVMDIFDQLHREGKTIVIVTHEQAVAKHAKRYLTITDGVVTESREE